MRVIPQAHRVGQLSHEVPEVPDEGLLLHERLSDGHVDESKAVDIELRAGEFSLHDHYIIHGSNPNTSRRRRCGYTMRFMPTTTQLGRSLRPDHPLYIVRGKDEMRTNSYVSAP